MEFNEWLKNTSGLSESSIYKYSHAVDTISKEMKASGVINKPINEMELFEIDLAISLIFNDADFIRKNEIGNKMYSNSLKWFRSYVQSDSKIEIVAREEERKIERNITINQTERVALIKSRIGQGLFRERLFDKYRGCIITGIDVPQVLVASHIQPWAISKNDERLNVNNGLLLSATYDRLFDSGLITFDDKGKIKISHFINERNRNKLNIQNNNTYDIKYCSEMKNFLEYHNDVVFIR